MKRMLIAALALLPFPALAGAEGEWPPEARGVGLPRPAWVLVVPASRDRTGAISAWDRSGPWMRRWIVPKPAKGNVRTVAITGDAEDARLIGGTELDNMDAAALGRLAAKYRAPALAIVVEGPDGDAAVAAWSAGRDASWDVTAAGEDAREGSLRIIGDLFSGETRAKVPDVAITGIRTVEGVDQYRLEAVDAAAMDVLRGLPGVSVIEVHADARRPWAVVTVTDGRAIEEVISSMGAR